MQRFALIALLFFSTAALAHPDHEHVSGFSAGLVHPFLGLDHLLAMLALGIWAAQWPRRSILIAPAVFVLSMLAGALFALSGGALPFVEHGIALSVILIGLLVATVHAQSTAAKLALPLIALGAVLHGYAHAAEIPVEAGAAFYISGFVLATAILHGLGIAIGMQLRLRVFLLRAAGAGVALAGCAFALAS